MLLIRALPPLPYVVVALVDSSLLTLLVFPILYTLSFRPLLTQIAERQRAEEALRRSHDDLELRVEERTREVEKGNEALRAALEETRQRQAEVAALLDGARAVLENHDFAMAARSLFNSCNRLLGARAGYLSLLRVDGTTNDLVLLEPGGPPNAVDQSLPMPVRELVESVLKTGEAEYDNLPTTPALSASAPVEHVALENVLVAPLALDGVIVGLLGLANKPGGFCQNDTWIATAFAELAAVALLNSRTEQELREAHDVLEARVLERTEELAKANEELRAEIADRERAEVALRESEDRYRSFLQTFQGIAFRANLGVAPLFFHGAVREITGYSEEEFIAGTPHWQEIIHPDDLAESVRTMERARSQPGFSTEREYRIIRKDGHVRWLREYVQNSCDVASKPTLIQGALYDITERMESERHKAVTHALLELFAQRTSRREYLDAVVGLVREWTAAQCVGVRLRDRRGSGSFEAQVGVDRDLLDSERCPSDQLDCPCSRLLLGALEAHDLPVTTASGSFHCTDIGSVLPSLTAGEKGLHKGTCLTPHLGSVAIVPIRYRGHVLGAIHLADPRNDTVSAVTLAFIESIVPLIGEAVQRFNLEEELRRFAREQSVLYAVATAATSFLDPTSLLDAVLEVLLPALDTDAGWVSMPGPTADDPPHIAVSCGVPKEFLAAEESSRFSTCPACGPLLCGGAIADSPQLVAACPRLSPDVLGTSGLHSHVSVPLNAGGDLLGILNVAWREPHHYTPEERAMLRAVGDLVGVALANARLFKQARTERERLQVLSRRLVEVQETERRVVARELHDDAGQTLTALMVGLRLLEREAGDPLAVTARVAELKRTADGVLENLHRLASNLRPASLDHLGLVATLRQDAQSLNSASGLAVRVEARGFDVPRLPPAVETALYRIAQEAMTNAIRHAKASQVEVLVDRRDDGIIIAIEDDGTGFDPEVAARGRRLGLVGMRERVEMLGGKLQLRTAPGSGTAVIVEVPNADSHTDSR